MALFNVGIAEFEKVPFDEFKKEVTVDSQAIYNALKLPKRATTGSAGYDFYAPFDFVLNPGETIKIPTGIRAKINDGWWLGILPRSGHGFKFRVQLDNTLGVIDSDYYNSNNYGHIMIKITNTSNVNESNKTLTVKQGEGFAQGIFLPYGIVVNDDADGIRNGGFGSTSALDSVPIAKED